MNRYDLTIIGGGPAGVAAAVYAARKKLTTVIIAESFGGQSIVSADVQNWIGTPSISGLDLAHLLESHIRAQEGITILDGRKVTDIVSLGNESDPKVSHFRMVIEGGATLETRAVLLATGSRRKKLGVPGEALFEGKGVMYCSICDAPLFNGKSVVVVGGGNAGLEAVIDLLPYAHTVTLLHRGSALKGDAVTAERVRGEKKVTVVLNAEATEIHGSEKTVTSITYRDRITNATQTLSVDGVFVEVGVLPNSALVSNIVTVNAFGEVVVDAHTQRTSHPFLWAAGDVTNGRYRQNNISAGDAIKATLDCYDVLR